VAALSGCGRVRVRGTTARTAANSDRVRMAMGLPPLRNA
jgi:hypothetical protein